MLTIALALTAPFAAASLQAAPAPTSEAAQQKPNRIVLYCGRPERGSGMVVSRQHCRTRASWQARGIDPLDAKTR